MARGGQTRAEPGEGDGDEVVAVRVFIRGGRCRLARVEEAVRIVDIPAGRGEQRTCGGEVALERSDEREQQESFAEMPLIVDRQAETQRVIDEWFRCVRL